MDNGQTFKPRHKCAICGKQYPWNDRMFATPYGSDGGVYIISDIEAVIHFYSHIDNTWKYKDYWLCKDCAHIINSGIKDLIERMKAVKEWKP